MASSPRYGESVTRRRRDARRWPPRSARRRSRCHPASHRGCRRGPRGTSARDALRARSIPPSPKASKKATLIFTATTLRRRRPRSGPARTARCRRRRRSAPRAAASGCGSIPRHSGPPSSSRRATQPLERAVIAARRRARGGMPARRGAGWLRLRATSRRGSEGAACHRTCPAPASRPGRRRRRSGAAAARRRIPKAIASNVSSAARSMRRARCCSRWPDAASAGDRAARSRPGSAPRAPGPYGASRPSSSASVPVEQAGRAARGRPPDDRVAAASTVPSDRERPGKAGERRRRTPASSRAAG